MALCLSMWPSRPSLIAVVVWGVLAMWLLLVHPLGSQSYHGICRSDAPMVFIRFVITIAALMDDLFEDDRT